MDTFLPARALTLKKDVARRGAQSASPATLLDHLESRAGKCR